MAATLIHAIALIYPESGSHLPWLAAAFGALSLLFLAGPATAFVRSRTTVDPMHPDRAERLITTGLYRVSRNPMYVGMALALCAVAAWSFAWPSLLVIAAFIGWMTRFQIIPEERALERRFGKQFRSYRQQVRRWL